MHPFRFAVQQGSARSGAAWTTTARRAESIGYDVLVMPDHLGQQLSPFAALAAASAATTHLRIGAFVFANDYRHPLILAREAATLDLLSGGRFEMGLGAGWLTSDYRQLSMTYDPAPRRIDRLQEAIPLIKRLLAGEAEIVGLVPGFDAHGRPHFRQATETATAEKVALIREAAGDGFERLELNLWLGDAALVGSGNSLLGSVAAAARWAPTAVYGSPYVLYGTLASVREKLLRRRDKLGISYYTVPSHAMESMAPLVGALAGK